MNEGGSHWQIKWPVLSPDHTPGTTFSVCRRCSQLLFISLKVRVMTVRTPTGLVVRKSAAECSQLFIPKGSLSRGELRKPKLTALPLSWSSPLVLFLTRQSEASGKPLLAPFCLEKMNSHFRELIPVLPNDPSPGCKVLLSFSRTNRNREMACSPKLRHLCHLALHLQSHKISLNTSLCFWSSLLPSESPLTVFTRKYYCHPPRTPCAVYIQS